jgi:hypothetical protein
MSDEVASLLWADDDSLDALDPLARRLRRNCFRLDCVTDYVEALKALESGGFHALLLDVLLPFARGAGALEFGLGLKLAEEAPLATKTVRNIGFLTVVRQEEVNPGYRELRDKYEDRIKFNYFDKTRLLEPRYFDSMSHWLHGK